MNDFLTSAAVLITGWLYLGLLVMAYLVGGLTLGVTMWGRAHPATFDVIAAPRLRAMLRRYWSYRGSRLAEILPDCELTRDNPTIGVTAVPRGGTVRS